MTTLAIGISILNLALVTVLAWNARRIERRYDEIEGRR
jgi:hypothetical protein